MKMNYQIEMEKIIEENKKQGKLPTLLLHSCCAPCSSYVLEMLSKDFSITVYYYNPNIYPLEEYQTRAEEQKRLIKQIPSPNPISFLVGEFEPEKFFEVTKGMGDMPEGGERCLKCYHLRLKEAAAVAKEGGYDYFTTSLSISPMKNAEKLNEIGMELAKEYQISYLLSDFKKKNGYKRSTELSKEYDLYRQDYCGCIFSKKEREFQKEVRKQADTALV